MPKKKKAKVQRKLPIVGIFLIVLGIMNTLDRYFPGMELMPMILIGLGIAMVIDEKK